MKKTIITISVVAVMAVAAVCIFCTVKANENPFLNANVAALAGVETPVVDLPCVKAVSVCTYIVRDAYGNLYKGETTGLRNI